MAAFARPDISGADELLADEQPGAVGVDPVAQPGPGAQQSLVGDLGGDLVQRDQPGAGECVKDRLSGRRIGRLGDKPGAVDPASGVLGAFPDLGHAQQELAGGVLPGGTEVLVGAFGGGGDRAADPAGELVAVDGEGIACALLPGGQQRVGEQRQPARVVGGSGCAGAVGAEVTQQYL